MVSIKSMLILAVAPLVIFAPSQAETYKFHPGQNIILGSAYSPRSPLEDKGVLGYYTKLPASEKTAAEETIFNYANIDIKEVQNIAELYDRLNFSAKAGAHYGAFNGKASLDLAKSLEFTDKNIVYVFTGVIKFSPETAVGTISLTDAGIAALSASRAEDPTHAAAFFNAAGSEIVTQIQRGSSISVIYNFRATSSENKKAMKASLDAKWANGNASAKIESIIKEVDKGASFTVNAYQYGGVLSNETILSIINKEPGNIPELRKVIQSSLEKTTRSTSPIIEFSTASVHSIPSIMMSPTSYKIFTNQIDDLLQSQYSDILVLNRRVNTLEEFLAEPNHSLFQENARADMTLKLQLTREALKKTILKSNEIIQSTSVANLPAYLIEIPEFNLKKWIVEDYVDVGSWMESKNYVYTGNEHGNTSGEFWPVIRFKFPSVITHAILRNGDVELSYLTPADIAAINQKNGSLAGYHSIRWSHLQHYAWGGDIPKHEANFFNTYVPAARRAHEADKYSIEVFTNFGSSKRVPLKNIYQDLKEMPSA